jgi:hypothetical protein
MTLAGNTWTEEYWPPQTRMFAVSGRFDDYSGGGIALLGGSTRSWSCPGGHCQWTYQPWATIPVARVGDGVDDNPPNVTWVVTNSSTGVGSFQNWADTANVQAVCGL